MTAVSLLRLYPRAWRERYGDEFVATIGDGALHLQQIIDIVAGAVDAWVSPIVRRQAQAGATVHTSEGDPMESTLKSICASRSLRYTKRDALIGAGVMLAGSLAMAIAAVLLKLRGYSALGEAVAVNGFFVSLVLSMPFWLLKGQSWRAQTVLVGGIIAFLVGISYLATLI
jgi:hypothetical protein